MLWNRRMTLRRTCHLSTLAGMPLGVPEDSMWERFFSWTYPVTWSDAEAHAVYFITAHWEATSTVFFGGEKIKRKSGGSMIEWHTVTVPTVFNYFVHFIWALFSPSKNGCELSSVHNFNEAVPATGCDHNLHTTVHKPIIVTKYYVL